MKKIINQRIKRRRRTPHQKTEDIILTDVEQEYLELVENKENIGRNQYAKKPNSKNPEKCD